MLKAVVTTDVAHESLMPLAKEILKDVAQVVYDPCVLKTEDELIEKCKDADAVIAIFEPFTEKVFASLPKLKLVSVLSIGYNCIDTAAAEKYGVAVCNNPTYCLDEVADHTAALMLACARRIIQFNTAVKEDRVWKPYAQAGNIKRLSKQTYGLIGFGNIARRVAKRMQGFGCNIISYDPFIKQEFADKYNVKMVELKELCAKSDMISLHAPLMPSTEKMLSKEMFEIMAAKRPIVVNCARGGLVDEEAFLDAIDTGKISMAGIDDFAAQKPDPNDLAFVTRKNVIITPHVGFYSDDSTVIQNELGLRHIKDFFSGSINEIPFVNKIRTAKA